MRRHSCFSLHRSNAEAWRTGSLRHSASAKASKGAVKPEPGRAHGMLSWVVLPQAPQATRGPSACSQASNWKKSRCRQERRSRSCTGWEAAPQAGQLSSAPEKLTSKSMRLAGTSGLTFSTTHGGCSPNALVNSASTPTLKPALPAAAGWACGQTQTQPAHMPTGLDDDQRFRLLDSTQNDEEPHRASLSLAAHLMARR